MGRLPYQRSFRIVADERKTPFVEALLRAEGFEFEKEPFSPICHRLTREPMPLGSSLAAFFGYIYIQDRSSMLPPLALNPPPGSQALDMCASPGSKSGFLAQLVGNTGLVLANEPNHTRLGTLRANMGQLNLLNVATCSYDGARLPLADCAFQHILLDPPCSGWGTEEKNPSVRKIWKGDKIRALVGLQRKLLTNAARLLAPGGSLLYSTCTTNPDENQEQAKYAEEHLGLIRVPLEAFPGFVFEDTGSLQGDLLVHGQESAAQGFYLCLLRKEGRILEGGDQGALSVASTGPSLEMDLFQNALVDFNLLPPGSVRLFGRQARFVPAWAERLLGKGAKWQAPLLGALTTGKKSRFAPAPRLRSILDPASPARVQLDNIQDLRALLSGQSKLVNPKFPEVSLWWRELPLGSAPVKSGRIIASFR